MAQGIVKIALKGVDDGALGRALAQLYTQQEKLRGKLLPLLHFFTRRRTCFAFCPQKTSPTCFSYEAREEAASTGVATQPRLKFQKWKVLNFEEGKRSRGASLKMLRSQCWKLGFLVDDADLAPGSSFSLGRQGFRARKSSNSRDRHDNRNARVRQIWVAPEKSDLTPRAMENPKCSRTPS